MNHSSPPEESETDSCQCEKQSSIPFLDVSCSIQNGKIETDLHRKKTDRNMYLLPSSCHPPTCTKNIPFSLSLRIVRICSKPEYREKQFIKLKELTVSRGYSEKNTRFSNRESQDNPTPCSSQKGSEKTGGEKASFCTDL